MPIESVSDSLPKWSGQKRKENESAAERSCSQTSECKREKKSTSIPHNDAITGSQLLQ